MTRLHDLTPLGIDADGDPILHDAILSMDIDVYVPRCDECGLPAGLPHAELCPLGKRNGRPRYPEKWMVFLICRGLACCPTERCESSHLRRHADALHRQRQRAA